MTPEEVIKLLREVDADAKASEGDYYADQFAWHGAGEIADAVEQMAAEIARLREERRWVPVGERLPEIDVPVFVWQQGCDFTAIGWREHRPYYIVPETIWTLGDELDKGYPPEKITHWIPLPPGPEAAG